MGIYDRDYYRDDGGRWWAAGGNRGTVALIAATVAGMIAYHLVVDHRTVTVGGEAVRVPVAVVQEYGEFYAPAVLQGQVWRFITSFFVSPFSFFAIVFGMLGLYWFGGEAETVYGTRRFVVFYLMAGVLANAAKFVLALADVGKFAHTLGPTAPLFATFVLFACHFPHRPIRVWFILPISAWVLVAVYLAVYLLSLAGDARAAGGNGVAVLADPLVGAAVGFLYHRTNGRLFGLFDGLAGRTGRRSRAGRAAPALRVYDDDPPRPAAVPTVPADRDRPTVPATEAKPTRGGVDEYLEARLDAVLEKVARHGRGSLTPEENEVLLRASEVFKKRRS